MKTIKAIGFYLASFTWGLPMTLIGCLAALCLLVAGHKPRRFHWFIYFEVGENWGGLNCGCFFIVNKEASLSIKQHESGHGVQNIMLGVFMPFVVGIPSMLRYWHREFKTQRGRFVWWLCSFLVMFVVGAALIISGGILALPALWIPGVIWIIYTVVIAKWQIDEIEKYIEPPYPAYDDFIVEGWATDLGRKYFK